MKRTDTMSARVEEYLDYRHALGYALRIEGGMLRDFAKFSDKSGHHGPPTCDLAIRWARLPLKADRLYWARRIEVLIGFARYCRIFDPQTEVPPRYVFGPAHRRRTPYIYSSRQLQELVACKGDSDSFGGFRRLTNATLFGLLCSTGLRISEALRLESSDVDLDHGVITVRESKRRSSRLVPIHPTVAVRLRDYANHRKNRFPNASFFFVNRSGGRLPYSTVRTAFRNLTDALGWTRQAKFPRLHDLRHTFACRVLVKWRKRSSGREDRIDWLSRYLGHERVSDTYWYFSAIPELFSASIRQFKYPKPD